MVKEVDHCGFGRPVRAEVTEYEDYLHEEEAVGGIGVDAELWGLDTRMELGEEPELVVVVDGNEDIANTCLEVFNEVVFLWRFWDKLSQKVKREQGFSLDG